MPGPSEEMAMMPLYVLTGPMRNVKGARENGSPWRRGQEAAAITPGLFSSPYTQSASGYEAARQALSEVVRPLSALPLREVQWSLSPPVIYIIRRPKTLPFRTGPYQSVGDFIHTR